HAAPLHAKGSRRNTLLPENGWQRHEPAPTVATPNIVRCSTNRHRSAPRSPVCPVREPMEQKSVRLAEPPPQSLPASLVDLLASPLLSSLLLLNPELNPD